MYFPHIPLESNHVPLVVHVPQFENALILFHLCRSKQPALGIPRQQIYFFTSQIYKYINIFHLQSHSIDVSTQWLPNCECSTPFCRLGLFLNVTHSQLQLQNFIERYLKHYESHKPVILKKKKRKKEIRIPLCPPPTLGLIAVRDVTKYTLM